jgi:hypothetical protein
MVLDVGRVAQDWSIACPFERNLENTTLLILVLTCPWRRLGKAARQGDGAHYTEPLEAISEMAAQWRFSALRPSRSSLGIGRRGRANNALLTHAGCETEVAAPFDTIS